MRTPELRVLSIAVLFAALPLAGCATEEEPAEQTLTEEAPLAEPETVPGPEGATAAATLDGNGISGTITFTEGASGVRVSGRIQGAPPGRHGFHVHETGECVGDFSSAGGHFNPDGHDHACPPTEPHHAGDLGNVEIGADGSATVEMTSAAMSLGTGGDSIVGKALIFHGGQDDCTSQPTGDAGNRLACGVIALAGTGATDTMTVEPGAGGEAGMAAAEADDDGY